MDGAIMGTETVGMTGARLPDRSGGGASPEDVDAGPDYQHRLGERLRAVRRARGMRLQDVEARSGGRFKAVVVGSYERGDRAIAAHRLAALADFYDVPLSELLPEDPMARAARGRTEELAIALDRLRARDDEELAALSRLVHHIQWLRGDYNGTILTLRGDDLRTLAVTVGVPPAELRGWLDERGVLAPS
jgi:transcriptional regulator with XRE-family HTH domain